MLDIWLWILYSKRSWSGSKRLYKIHVCPLEINILNSCRSCSFSLMYLYNLRSPRSCSPPKFLHKVHVHSSLGVLRFFFQKTYVWYSPEISDPPTFLKNPCLIKSWNPSKSKFNKIMKSFKNPSLIESWNPQKIHFKQNSEIFKKSNFNEVLESSIISFWGSEVRIPSPPKIWIFKEFGRDLH